MDKRTDPKIETTAEDQPVADVEQNQSAEQVDAVDAPYTLKEKKIFAMIALFAVGGLFGAIGFETISGLAGLAMIIIGFSMGKPVPPCCLSKDDDLHKIGVGAHLGLYTTDDPCSPFYRND